MGWVSSNSVRQYLAVIQAFAWRNISYCLLYPSAPDPFALARGAKTPCTTVPQKDGHATATRALAHVSAPAPPRGALPVKKGTILRATRAVQTYHPLGLKSSRLYGYGSG